MHDRKNWMNKSPFLVSSQRVHGDSPYNQAQEIAKDGGGFTSARPLEKRQIHAMKEERKIAGEKYGGWLGLLVMPRVATVEQGDGRQIDFEEVEGCEGPFSKV